MIVDLTVLTSTKIKRKKPWSRLSWIGKRKEDMLLVDKNRLSILHLPSGQTTKKCGTIHSHLQSTAQMAISVDCLKIGALLFSGDVLIWDKDSNITYRILGIPELAIDKQTAHFTKLFVGPEAQSIVVVMDYNRLYVWKAAVDQGGPTEHRHNVLHGDWSTIETSAEVHLPSVENREATLVFGFRSGAAFVSSSIYIVYISSKENCLCLSVCEIRNSRPTCVVGNVGKTDALWKQLMIRDRDLHSDFLILKKRGSYAACVSASGSCLAVAANQYGPHSSQIVFVSMDSFATHNMGITNIGNHKGLSTFNKEHWVCDMCWTQDDCFLFGITRDGSVLMTTRLGHGLLSFNTQECVLEEGPTVYNSIYDLVSSVQSFSSKRRAPDLPEVKSVVDGDDISIASSVTTSEGSKHLRPRFSVASHRTTSHVVASDGFLVVLLDLPSNLSGLLPTTHTLLAHAQHSLRLMTSQAVLTKVPSQYSLQSLDSCGNQNTLKRSTTSELRRKCSGYGSLKRKKVEESASESWEKQHLSCALRGLLDAWALLSSNQGSWTVKLDQAAQQVIQLFSRAMHTCVGIGLVRTKELFYTLQLCFKLLQFDGSLHQLLPSSLKLLHMTTDTASLCIPHLVTAYERLQFLKMLLHLILFGERSIARSCSFVSCSFFKTPYNLNEDCYSQATLADEITVSAFTDKCCRRAWGNLYLEVISMHKALSSCPGSKGDLLDLCENLLCHVQAHIQAKGWDIGSFFQQRKPPENWSKTTRYLLGYSNQAVCLWIKKLLERKSSQTTKSFHKILYAFCEHGQLKSVLALVSAAVAGHFNMSAGGRPSERSGGVAWSLANSLSIRAVANLVCSFARIFASFYGKEMFCIYPVHVPVPMASSLSQQKGFARPVLISPSWVSWQLSSQGLEWLLTRSLCFECLMLTGRWSEAVQFALCLGQWKEAWALASLCSMAAAPGGSNSPFMESVPKPQDIILPQLELMLGLNETFKTDENQVLCTKEKDSVESLQGYLLASLLLCPSFDPVPLLLQSLSQRLVSLINAAPLLVPGETYLPAPPLYCPPQSVGYEEGDIPVRESEEGLRLNVSLVLQKLSSLLYASYLGVPLLSWFISYLKAIWKDMNQDTSNMLSFISLGELCETCSDLPVYCPETDGATPLHWVMPDETGARQCLQSLREICGVLWCLVCRDRLSEAFRQLQGFTQRDSLSQEKKQLHSTEHLHFCYQVLHFSVFMFPFTKYLSSGDSLALLFLDVVLELPPTKELASLVAQLMVNSECPTSNVDQKLKMLLEKWKNQECDPMSDVWAHSKSFPLVLKDSTNPDWETIYFCILSEQKEAFENRKIHFKEALASLDKGETLSSDYFTYAYELEIYFIEFLVPLFQIGLLKNQVLEPFKPHFPLLRVFHDELTEVYIQKYEESVKYLQEQEYLELRPISMLDLLGSYNRLTDEAFKFSASSYRKSVLYRNHDGVFCSPSKKAVEKYEKLFMRVRNCKTRKRKLVATNLRWKTLSRLFKTGKSFATLKDENSSINVLPSGRKIPLRPTAAQEVLALTQLLAKEINKEWIQCFAWIYGWLVNNNSDSSSFLCKPLGILLAFARAVSGNGLDTLAVLKLSSASLKEKPSVDSDLPPTEKKTCNQLGLENMVSNLSLVGKGSGASDSSFVGKEAPNQQMSESTTSDLTLIEKETAGQQDSKSIGSDSPLVGNGTPSQQILTEIPNFSAANSTGMKEPTGAEHTVGEVTTVNRKAIPSKETDQINTEVTSKNDPQTTPKKSFTQSDITPKITKKFVPFMHSVALDNNSGTNMTVEKNGITEVECKEDRMTSILKNLRKSVDFITNVTSDFAYSIDGAPGTCAETLAPVETPPSSTIRSLQLALPTNVQAKPPTAEKHHPGCRKSNSFLLNRNIKDYPFVRSAYESGDIPKTSIVGTQTSALLNCDHNSLENVKLLKEIANTEAPSSQTTLAECDTDWIRRKPFKTESDHEITNCSTKRHAQYFLAGPETLAGVHAMKGALEAGHTYLTLGSHEDSKEKFTTHPTSTTASGSIKGNLSPFSEEISIGRGMTSLSPSEHSIEKVDFGCLSVKTVVPKHPLYQPVDSHIEQQSFEKSFTSELSPIHLHHHQKTLLNFPPPVKESSGLMSGRQKDTYNIPLLYLNCEQKQQVMSSIENKGFMPQRSLIVLPKTVKTMEPSGMKHSAPPPLLSVDFPPQSESVKRVNLISHEKINSLFLAHKVPVEIKKAEVNMEPVQQFRKQRRQPPRSKAVAPLPFLNVDLSQAGTLVTADRRYDCPLRTVSKGETMVDTLSSIHSEPVRPDEKILSTDTHENDTLHETTRNCRPSVKAPDMDSLTLKKVDQDSKILNDVIPDADTEVEPVIKNLEQESKTLDDAISVAETEVKTVIKSLNANKTDAETCTDIFWQKQDAIMQTCDNQVEHVENMLVSEQETSLHSGESSSSDVSGADKKVEEQISEKGSGQSMLKSEMAVSEKISTELIECCNSVPDLKNQMATDSSELSRPMLQMSTSTKNMEVDEKETEVASLNSSPKTNKLAAKTMTSKGCLYERLGEMQMQLDAIENISANVHQDFLSARKVLKNLEYEADFGRTKHKLSIHSAVGQSKTVGIRKEALGSGSPVESQIKKANYNELLTYPTEEEMTYVSKASLDMQSRPAGTRKNRISFGTTETVLLPDVDEFEQTFRIVPYLEGYSHRSLPNRNMSANHQKCSASSIEKMYKIYGSKRLPRKVQENLGIHKSMYSDATL